MLAWHVGNLSSYSCIYQSKLSLCLKFSLVSMVTQHQESPLNAQFPDTVCYTHAQKSRPSLPARYGYTTRAHPDLELHGTVCESALYSFPTSNSCHVQFSQSRSIWPQVCMSSYALMCIKYESVHYVLCIFVSFMWL